MTILFFLDVFREFVTRVVFGLVDTVPKSVSVNKNNHLNVINLKFRKTLKNKEMIELSKVQLQESLNNFLLKENGLTTILEMTLNSLMYAEPEQYLKENYSNKGNGYRKAFGFGMGKQIELRIPRDRLGMFQPMVLALIRDQKQQLEDLSFEALRQWTYHSPNRLYNGRNLW